MHGMIVEVEFADDPDDTARKLLNEFTIPTVKAQPGFVRGVWMRNADRSEGRGVVLFETEEQAKATAELARQGPPEGAPLKIRSVEVFEVVAEA